MTLFYNSIHSSIHVLLTFINIELIFKVPLHTLTYKMLNLHKSIILTWYIFYYFFEIIRDTVKVPTEYKIIINFQLKGPSPLSQSHSVQNIFKENGSLLLKMHVRMIAIYKMYVVKTMLKGQM